MGSPLGSGLGQVAVNVDPVRETLLQSRKKPPPAITMLIREDKRTREEGTKQANDFILA